MVLPSYLLFFASFSLSEEEEAELLALAAFLLERKENSLSSLMVNSTVSSDYQSAHPFSCSASESELSEEDEDDDDEEDDDEEEEEDEEELELLLFISASFPFTALSLLPVRSGGWRLAGGDRFPL